ncbi:hypothetical protein KN10_0002 [Anoxybacillus flavithermus NBRC 109594]|uniref:Uncharacterized protein n=1 Tax=Anoxybacillus flavithermus NBRC 109594 TaxID=1315967 RepID=R4F8B2_9BACL|nr:hypothetical protein KN10_0002 [Anoxybacillus flavithermus NBRC 109594]
MSFNGFIIALLTVIPSFVYTFTDSNYTSFSPTKQKNYMSKHEQVF